MELIEVDKPKKYKLNEKYYGWFVLESSGIYIYILEIYQVNFIK
jgi:hypothetical protein